MRIRQEGTKLRFFDTNILVYALGPGNPHQARAEQLLAEGGLVSVQVLNELVSVMRRRFQTPWDDLRGMLAGIQVLCGMAEPTTQATHERALDVAQRLGFHIYDATIIASATLAGCDTLYSEDMQDGQQICSLTIRNPFISQA
jgi:predicted nucleic acid-binding protein